ncbi:membrane protein [Klebsiella variicola]|uniref:Membrane protein n=1 Tax=Klebsiella variicola TaxID=244366 RepID=A0A7H4MJB9_KLEVA|nr:membrane protein [Klebsiella variicola]
MLATLLVALVAIIHLAILVLEMFLWEAPPGAGPLTSAPISPGRPGCWRPTRGCITVFWPPAWRGGCGWGRRGCRLVIFFLACVLAAGIFGALTASRKILYIQALPALLALLAVVAQA